MKALKKFASFHANAHNLFNKGRRSAVLACNYM
jgi:hypothetical protein